MTIVSFLLFPSGKFKSDFTTLCTSKCSLLQESFFIETFSAFEKTVVLELIPHLQENLLEEIWQLRESIRTCHPDCL